MRPTCLGIFRCLWFLAAANCAIIKGSYPDCLTGGVHLTLLFSLESIRVIHVFRGPLLLSAGLTLFFSSAVAEPLSKKTDIDFFRDVPSRNLKGLAARSDGRLISGPAFSEITAPAPADLLWCLESGGDSAHWLLGTGPDGKIIEVTLNAAGDAFTARDLVKLDDPQIYALKRLADGSILAGTSPKGALCLVRDGVAVARAAFPVDSIFDLLLLDENTALAATGNPGRIYRIDLKKFATAGIAAEKITTPALLAERGITLFGEIRDRNVRRIVPLASGRIAAGSAPKGNIYTFARDGGPPVLLQENREAEVTDLLPQPNGDLYATIVYSSTSNEGRITPPPPRSGVLAETPPPPPATPEKFAGRSSLIWFPADGFAETLASRNSTAFYRLARHGDILVIAGGEQGELLGYDLKARLSLTFAGSAASQLNGLAAFPGVPGKFLLLRNNAPGLALLDFNATGEREIETRRLDLSTPSQLGALRFNRLRSLAPRNLALDLKVSNGSDEIEGWGPWTPLSAATDAGWRADGLRGRYVKLRLRVLDAPATPGFEIDRATLFTLPQNRRPALQEFRVLSPGYALVVNVEQPQVPILSLNQLLQTGTKEEDGKRKNSFFSSQVVPAPGTQVVLWTITDPDGDNFLCTFSVRRDGDTAWTELAANTRDSYAQFETSHMPDGVYFTRLVATETAPRPVKERLSQTFETDDLIIDHTPPEMVEATARRDGDRVIVTVRGRDQLSLLDGIEVIFNNGVRETVEQPADGVRDGREETFVLDVALAKISNATSLEVTLYDAAGNGSSKRLSW